jgi:hypothetical protein
MTGHLWASRLVVVVFAVLVTASVLFAAAWSALTPWSAGSQDVVAAPAARVPAAAHAAAMPSPSLLRDDFESDRVGAQPEGWTLADGLWDGVVQDGSRVVRHAAGQSYGHLVAGSPGWRDYSVSVRLRPTPLSTGFAGVAARYQGPGDYYACGVYFGTAVRLWRVKAGAMALLDARRMDMDTDRFHEVRLVVKGGQVSCVFDQDVVLRAVDESFSSGRIALVAASDEAAEFDDVIVGT